MKKKFLSLILCFGVIMNLFCPQMNAAEGLDDTRYEILCALGFFDDKAVYNADVSVQKIELLNAVIMALPEEKIMESSESTGFSDIEPTDALSKLAYNTYVKGLIGDDSELKAYEELTLEGASEILVNLLGYGALKGNRSYSSVASDLGITKDNPNTRKFTMKHMVNMLYRALDTEIMELNIAGDTPEYNVADGKTLMSEVYGIGKGTGVITANEYTGIFGRKRIGAGRVQIDESEYLTDDSQLKEFLGCKVLYYWRETDDHDRELMYAEPDKKTVITDLDAQYIESYSERVYRYEINNKIKRTTFGKDASIVYNGMSIKQPFSSYLPEVGSVRLIDNDGDNINDVVIITDYKIVVADGFHFDDAIIYDMYGTENIQLEKYSNPDSYKVKNADGSAAKFTDIDSYDVLYVAKSQDESYITIVISKQEIAGVVTSKNSENIVINNVTYEIAKTNYLTNVEVGTQGIFHLDASGRVAAFEKSGKTGKTAGYLVKANFIEGIELNLDYDTVKIRVFEESGEFKDYYTAKKVYLNDTKTNASNIESSLTALDASGQNKVVPQLIQYKTNNLGQVTRLYTAHPFDNTSLDNYEGFSEITNGIEYLVQRYREYQFNFRVTDDTVIFSVPDDITKTKNFEVYKNPTDTVPFVWNYFLYCQAFAEESNAAEAEYLIWYPDKKESNGMPKNVFAVSRVDDVINEDDEVVKMLTGFKDGEEVSYALDSDLSKADVKSGDIVTLSLDGKNQPTSMTKLFSYEEQKQLVTTATDQRNSARYAFWNVYSVKGNDLIVTKKKPGDTILRTETEFVFMNRIPNIYKYNGKTFEKATAKDITGFSKNPSKYSRVFTATDTTTPYICAIYNME